jgi:hypothetical protein
MKNCRRKDSQIDERKEDALLFCRICFFGDDAFLEKDAIHRLLSCYKCGYSGQKESLLT